MVLTAMDDPDTPLPAAYEAILTRSVGLGFTMNSDVLTGALLRTLAAGKPGGRLLELGTGCGLGTSWLLDGMDAAASLVSVDTDARVQEIARSELGADARLSLVRQDGGEFLEGCTERFDLIYADALPGKFTHRETALGLLHPGGLYVVDDLLPQPHWPEGHQQRVDAFVAAMQAADGFHMTLLTWSTGIIVATRARETSRAGTAS